MATLELGWKGKCLLIMRSAKLERSAEPIIV
mgnify:CR=1 FL=1|jgi:hypothetical protein